MVDSLKFLTVERNGSELEFPEEEDFIPELMPFSEPGYLSDNVKAAILETSTVAGQSRFSLTVGNNGTSSIGDYLDFFYLVSSFDAPYIVSEPSEITTLAVSNKRDAIGATFSVLRNGVNVASVVIPGSTPRYGYVVLVTPVSLVAGDQLSVQQTSAPNTNDVFVSIGIKTT